MSTSAKTGIILVVILAVIIIAWFFMSGKPTPAPVTTVVQTPVATVTPTPPPTLSDKISGTGMTDVNDSSTDSLYKDTVAIDAQLTGLGTDSANVNQAVISNQ